ncbi:MULTISPECIES: MFS transporter [unclassified Micromonospora]|uniref:MFS transporter n=1 Tax=unclassified Micromonospora TaxID=2617518 RepID=UPI0033B4E7E8
MTRPAGTTTPTTPGGPDLLSDRHIAALPPALIAIGLVTAVISSLGAQLIPTVARHYQVSVSSAQWSLTVALMAGAVATPTMGRLGDGPRRRQVILGCLGLTLAGSLLAAVSANFAQLLAGRALQGVGLGMVPLVITVARENLPMDRARSTIAALSVTTVSGVGLGYPITGLITDRMGLRAAFWFGVGISAAVLVLAWLVIPARSAARHRPFDLFGVVALSASLVALLVGLSQGEHWGWSSGPVIGLLVSSAALLALWVAHEIRCAHPLVELRLLRDRSVLTADVATLLAGVGIYLLMALVIRFVQTPPTAGYGFGVPVVVAGLVLVPFSVGSVVANRVAPALRRRVGAEPTITLGAFVFVAATGLLALWREQLWQPFLAMGLAGLGVGLTFSASLGVLLNAVPAEETGSATSFNQVLRSIGYSIGSTLSALVLDVYTEPGRDLPSNAGYGAAFGVGIGVWLGAAVLSLLLPARRPFGRRSNIMRSCAGARTRACASRPHACSSEGR